MKNTQAPNGTSYLLPTFLLFVIVLNVPGTKQGGGVILCYIINNIHHTYHMLISIFIQNKEEALSRVIS